MKNRINVVSQLKKAGVRVDVYHGRRFRDLRDGSIIIMSRGEMSKRNDFHHFELLSTGGFTMVDLTFNGKKYHEKRNTPVKEQFHRKLNLNIALGRSLKQMRVSDQTETFERKYMNVG